MNGKPNYYKSLNIFQYYAIICLVLKWIAMYRNIRNGVIVGVFLMLGAIIMLVKDKFSIDISSRTTVTVLLYIVYSLFLSFVAISKGYSFSLIFSEIANTLMPIVLFFIGMKFSDNQASEFEKIIIISGIIVLISGIYYNATLNDPYYIKFITENNPNFSLHGFSIYPRLNSFFGSVVCGTFGCICTALSFRYMGTHEQVKFWFTFACGFLLGMLTLQRSAMVCVIFVVFFMMFLNVRKGYLNIRIPIIIAIILAIMFLVIMTKMPNIYSAIFDRFNSISSAVSERNNSWNNAFNNSIIDTIFGYGFASGGQRAIGISATTVNDGNYFKIIYECGFVGLGLFAISVIQTLNRSKLYTDKIAYIVIIVSCLLQMIGSNILTFQFTASLFWYAMGRLNTPIDDYIYAKS